MAEFKDFTFNDLIGDEDFDDIPILSNSKASAETIDQVAVDLTLACKINAINYAAQNNPAIIRAASLKKITAWLLLQFAENGTSAATQYPEGRIEFVVHEQTIAPQQAQAATYVQRNTYLTLAICVNTIRTRTTQRHWARYYADLTYRLAKTKNKIFAWGRSNGVPSHYGYLGFDTADFISQELLSLSERKCIRRTTAFAIVEAGQQEITEDDQVVTAVGSKRNSQQ